MPPPSRQMSSFVSRSAGGDFSTSRQSCIPRYQMLLFMETASHAVKDVRAAAIPRRLIMLFFGSKPAGSVVVV